MVRDTDALSTAYSPRGLPPHGVLPPTAPPRKSKPPLGLPSGSVRALLTLLVVAVVVVLMIRGQDVEVLWTETLLIAMAHYFTSRRFINLPPEVLRRLEAEGYVDAESHPLYLPRHSVRVILVSAFVGLAVYLQQHGRLFEVHALSLLGVVLAYLLGIFVRGLISWWAKQGHASGVHGWENLKALVVLAVLCYTAAAYLLNRPDLVPPHLRNATLGLVLFYFGSR